MDHSSARARAAASGSSRGIHDAKEKIVLGQTDQGRRRAVATVKRCSTFSRRTRRRRSSSRPSWRGVSSPTRRRRRWSIAPPRGSARPAATSAKWCKTILTSPEFFSAEAYRAKVKSPFEFVVSAVRATGTEVNNAMLLVQNVRTARHAALRLPAADRLPRQGGGVGQHRRAPQSHELRRAARGRTDAGHPDRHQPGRRRARRRGLGSDAGPPSPRRPTRSSSPR